MKVWQHPWIWQALSLILFVAVMIAGNPTTQVFLPFLVAAAWIYVIWRLLTARRLAAPAASLPVPVLRPAPTITGTIAAPHTDRAIDPEAMAAYLNAQIIGQSVVGHQLARGIYRRLAQARRGKPVFTVLLSGPTGTGKTAMAKALAAYLYGDERAMLRIDCANVIGEAGLQTLIGSPKGYAGSSSWGALTAHLRATPRTLILFDEIEKAVTSPTAPMAKLLLSLLDEGVVTEQSDGTKVSATQAVIVLTSNAAHERLGAIYERYREQPDELVRATKDTLRDHFAPEFLARLDLVTTLAPLDEDARARIIALHAQRIGESYGLEVQSVDAAFVNEALRLWSTREGYGTREVIRWIEEVAADAFIQAREAGQQRVALGLAHGQAWVEEA